MEMTMKYGKSPEKAFSMRMRMHDQGIEILFPFELEMTLK
jgi:hypothetical protein